jgi:uncharacterized protein with HEPN domain
LRNSKLYLTDILEAMEAIERFVESMKFENFEVDDKTSSAVIRKFEIIGEATKNVPERIRQQYSTIPWREMAGMRDKLIHFYFGIKYDLVWRTIKDVIPQVKPLIRNILEDLELESKKEG